MDSFNTDDKIYGALLVAPFVLFIAAYCLVKLGMFV